MNFRTRVLAAGLALLSLLTVPVLAEDETPGAVERSLEQSLPAPEALEEGGPLQEHPGIIRPEDIDEHHQVDVFFNWEGKREAHTGPQSNVPVLYRVDSGPETEFRIGWGGLTWQNGTTGFKDVVLGTKWNFLQGRTSWGVLFLVELPTGSAGFQDPEIEPGAVLSYNYKFSDRFDLTLNAGVQSMVDGVSRDRYFQGSYAAQAGFELDGRNRLSAGFTGYGPDQTPGGITRLAAHLGYSFIQDRKTEYSLYLHRGFAPRGVDWGVTAGVSRRF